MSDQRRAYGLGTWSMRYVSVRYSASVAAQSKLCGVLAVHLLIRHSWVEGNSEGKKSCAITSLKPEPSLVSGHYILNRPHSEARLRGYMLLDHYHVLVAVEMHIAI